MNTLRRSFIYSIINDEKLKSLNASFGELQKVVHLVFIAGEDYEMTQREKILVEGIFTITDKSGVGNFTFLRDEYKIFSSYV
jgi:hypothetical protein